MHVHTASILFCTILATAMAQPEAAVAASKISGTNKKEAALDHLLSERESEKAMQAAIKEARDSGISEQTILEARFLYHVDRNEDEAVAAMQPEFAKLAEHFKVQDSAIFTTKEDWLAVTEYIRAIAALELGDKAGFKSHITEAFWLSPRQAAAFAPHIERMRLEESMTQVRVDFENKFLTVVGNQSVSLKKIMTNHQAMILHFWSPANHDCMDSLPDFAATFKALSAHGIAVATLVPNTPDNILIDSKKAIDSLDPKTLGTWIIDESTHTLTNQLRVQVMPTFVLISNDGRVLFNGDPSDDALWEALKHIDSKIIRPQIHEVTN